MKPALLLAIILTTLVSYGCTTKGHLEDTDKNKLVTCVDSRDGSQFQFETNSVSNVRLAVGSATSSFDAVTLDGEAIRLDKSMEAFLKCTKAPINAGVTTNEKDY